MIVRLHGRESFGGNQIDRRAMLDAVAARVNSELYVGRIAGVSGGG